MMRMLTTFLVVLMSVSVAVAADLPVPKKKNTSVVIGKTAMPKEKK